MHKVVFNADDLGTTSGVNEAVHAAVEAGLVREMSLMVTTEGAEEGARIAHTLADRARVGLHFTLTAGRALTGPIRGVTDRTGKFLPLRRVLARSVLGRVDINAIRRELEAQLARFRGFGFEPSHINGHEHVHAFPRVCAVVLEVASKHEVPHVRASGAALPRPLTPRTAAIALLGRALRARNERLARPRATLPVVGLELYGCADYRKEFLRTGRELFHTRTEWVVHPRFEDGRFEQMIGVRPGSQRRSLQEVDVLTDPEVVETLRELAIEPTQYR